MAIRYFALALVFLGATASANAQSSNRQTDESLLANNTLSQAQTTDRQAPATVSAIESRELREYYSDKMATTLTRKLDLKLAIQPADIKIN